MAELNEKSSQTEWINALIDTAHEQRNAELRAISARYRMEDLKKRFHELCKKECFKVSQQVPLVVVRNHDLFIITFSFNRTNEEERITIQQGFYMEDRCEYEKESPETAGTTLGA